MTRAQDRLLDLVAGGARIDDARRTLGISVAQLTRWIDHDALFRVALGTAAGTPGP